MRWRSHSKNVAAQLRSGEPKQAVEAALADLTKAVSAAELLHDPDEKLRAILEAERTVRSRLAELRSRLRVPQQRGFALSRALSRNLAAHRVEFSKFDSEILAPAYTNIEEIVANASPRP